MMIDKVNKYRFNGLINRSFENKLMYLHVFDLHRIFLAFKHIINASKSEILWLILTFDDLLSRFYLECPSNS